MPAPSFHDQTRYCDNCGISFLWTGEEQRAGDSPAPLTCPGCRQILPADQRERGLVKWYSPRKRFGFIRRIEQPDLFVHRSALKGARRLQTGDLVEFEVIAAKNGPAARAVRLLAAASADDV